MNSKHRSKKYAVTLVAIQLLLGIFTIVAAAPFRVQFTTQPTGSTIGASLGNVVVQLVDKGGTNVAQSGTTITVSLNKSGAFTGATNLTTDPAGKATFPGLKVNLPGNNFSLTARSTGLKSATSTAFNVGKGSVVATLAASATKLAYGQKITFTVSIRANTPATNVPTGSIVFKDGVVTLGTATLGTNGVGTFSMNQLTAATTNHVINAIYSGDANFLTATSSNLLVNVNKLALTVAGITAAGKVYDGTTNASMDFSKATLATVLAGDTVALNSNLATGAFASKAVGTNKVVTITGLTLGGASAGNYTLTPPTTTATITARSLTITATGVDKAYNGTPAALVTLADNRLAGDVFTNKYTSAVFTNKNAGNNVLINVSGIASGGADAGNYALSSPTTTATANIAAAPLTVTGIIASNKVYDATTAVGLNFASAKLVTVFAGDSVSLNTAAAKGSFANKLVGTGKIVSISGLALTGTNAGNYLLTQPTTNANITARSLAITALAANKIYDATTATTVTIADNHLVGDAVMASFTNAAFASKNAGSNLVVTVSGLAISGADVANYAISNLTAKATATITPAPLAISSVMVNNKIYDGTTNATLSFSNATLATVFSGDVVTVNSAAAKGGFSSKMVGSGKPVTISGVALAGAQAGNYKLTSQPTATANITARSLAITAKGVNKAYDGTDAATVTLNDNRLAGDIFTNNYASATFTNKNMGTAILINVSGLAIAGTDATNYNLPATSTTATANISSIVLNMAAANVSRPYATTNPVLTVIYTGFAAGESSSSLAGVPALTTAATTNSPVGTYLITVTKGSLASPNYTFTFSNGLLTVTKAVTSALVYTTANPALTNQTITFAAKVSPPTTTVLPLAGSIQFKSNGTNKLGSAITVTNGLAKITVPATTLGKSNVVITAEYSDPAGNFSPSTNSLLQSIVAVIVPPPSKLALAPSFANGSITAQLSGVAGQAYIIQASTDLAHWISLATNIADAAGVVSLIDSNAVAFPSRFYRAYSP